MDDGVVAHVDCHMSAVADDISGLCLGKTANCVSGASLLTGGSRQADAEMLIHSHDKAGAVCTVRQAGAAVHIRIAHKLLRISDHGLSLAAAGRGCADLRVTLGCCLGCGGASYEGEIRTRAA